MNNQCFIQTNPTTEMEEPPITDIPLYSLWSNATEVDNNIITTRRFVPQSVSKGNVFTGNTRIFTRLRKSIF